LYSFLNAAADEHLKDLSLHAQTSIKSAREELRSFSETGTTLGPLSWDHSASSGGLITLAQRNLEAFSRTSLRDLPPINATRLARGIATAELEENHSGKVTDHMIDGLAAYHLLTMFGEDLSTVTNLLNLKDTAGSILSIVDQRKLRLNDVDRRILQTSKNSDRKTNIRKTPAVDKDISNDETYHPQSPVTNKAAPELSEAETTGKMVMPDDVEVYPVPASSAGSADDEDSSRIYAPGQGSLLPQTTNSLHPKLSQPGKIHGKQRPLPENATSPSLLSPAGKGKVAALKTRTVNSKDKAMHPTVRGVSSNATKESLKEKAKRAGVVQTQGQKPRKHVTKKTPIVLADQEKRAAST